MIKRTQRAWIKVQLSAHAESHAATQVVETWKSRRQATLHLIRAIRLYSALNEGDFGALEEYFPGLALALGTRPVFPRRSGSSAPAVTYLAQSESQQLSEALDGLGMGNLEFG